MSYAKIGGRWTSAAALPTAVARDRQVVESAAVRSVGERRERHGRGRGLGAAPARVEAVDVVDVRLLGREEAVPALLHDLRPVVAFRGVGEAEYVAELVRRRLEAELRRHLVELGPVEEDGRRR